MCGILNIVVTSVAEAKLGAFFVNYKKGKTVRLILEETGHPQSPTPVHVNNSTAVGIANDTVEKQHSCSMEMSFLSHGPSQKKIIPGLMAPWTRKLG